MDCPAYEESKIGRNCRRSRHLGAISSKTGRQLHAITKNMRKATSNELTVKNRFNEITVFPVTKQPNRYFEKSKKKRRLQ